MIDRPSKFLFSVDSKNGHVAIGICISKLDLNRALNGDCLIGMSTENNVGEQKAIVIHFCEYIPTYDNVQAVCNIAKEIVKSISATFEENK